MKAKRALKSINVSQCCRYSYGTISNNSIKSILKKNKWLINDTWMFWSLFSEVENKPLPDIDKDPVASDDFICFSGTVHDYESWKNVIDWNIYGTWFVYTFPIKPTIIKKSFLLGTMTPLNIDNEYKCRLPDFFGISSEWRFLHSIQPDIFLSRVDNDVIIGALDQYHVWLINDNLKS